VEFLANQIGTNREGILNLNGKWEYNRGNGMN
jgi:hypothetical protein